MKYEPWRADGTRETRKSKPKLTKEKRGRPKIDRDKAVAYIREYGAAGAAKLLGISLMTAYRIQREYGIQVKRGCLSKERQEKLGKALKVAGK